MAGVVDTGVGEVAAAEDRVSEGSGNTLNTFAWGPDGLTERYQHQNVGVPYIDYLYDPDGNVVHRVRSIDPNTSSGDAVFTIDTVLWDDYGRLHADIDTISGGFHTSDMVGYGGQQGRYTDVGTLTDPSSGQIAAGTYLATEGPGGAVFYNPAGGIALARLHADDANEYADFADIYKDADQQIGSLAWSTLGGYAGGAIGAGAADGAWDYYCSRWSGVGQRDALLHTGQTATLTYLGGKVLEYGGRFIGEMVAGLGSGKRLVVPAPRSGFMPEQGVRVSPRPPAEYDTVPYSRRVSGFENHHGVLDVWAKTNVPGYGGTRPGQSPSMLLTPENHAATKAVYRDWLEARTGKRVCGVVDWSKVSPQEIQKLTEDMFDAARVPENARRAYYRAFHAYIYR